MKGKRRRGGDTSTGTRRSDELEEPVVGNQQTARPIYVVVNTWDDSRPVYSLYKLDYPCSSCSLTPPPLHPLATLDIEGGRTFLSVQTRRRKWIVAVAGRHSIVFDADTEEVVHGPELINGKECPVLLAVEDKIYALSSFPMVKGDLDFEPWFEVLDLSRATVADGRLKDCAWEELPSPPCFPCHLGAHEFFSPPVIILHSCLVVGSYILLSVRSHQHATYAFDTVSAKWHKVHGSSKTLPFIACHTPQLQHGVAAGLYLGESSAQALGRLSVPALSAYSIKLTSCDKEEDGIKLSVTEFPMESSQTCKPIAGIHYSPLDKGTFCLLDWKSRKRVNRSRDDDILADEFHWSKKATITVKTYQIEDNSLLQEEDEPVNKITISEQPEQAYNIRTNSGGFISPAFLAVFKT